MKSPSRKLPIVSPADCHLLSIPSGFQVNRYNYIGHGEILRDMHCAFEMGIVLRGSCRRFYLDHQVDLLSGQVWFCDMWQPHGFQALTSCSVIVITFSLDVLYEFATEALPWSIWTWLFNASFSERPQTPPKKTNVMIKKIRRLHQTFHSSGIYSQHYAKLILQEIILDYLAISNPKPISSKKSHEINIVNSAIKLVLNRPEFCTLSTICHQLSVHPKTFSRYCTKYLNMSFAEFNIRHRLTCVAKKLRTSNLSIKHIAYEFGFTDTSHLCHAFARYYNCTPTQYRSRSIF